MVIFWVFTVCGGFTRSMVIFRKLFSQCMHTDLTYLIAISSILSTLSSWWLILSLNFDVTTAPPIQLFTQTCPPRVLFLIFICDTNF